MFCTKCGAQNAEGTQFCANCGAALAAEQAAPTQYTTAYQQQQVVYVQPKIPGRGFGISSLVLGIIGLVYSFSFMAMAIAYREESRVRNDFYDAINRSNPGDEELKIAVITMAIVFASMSIMAVAFSIASKSRGYGAGTKTAGLILGIIGLMLYLTSIVTVLI